MKNMMFKIQNEANWFDSYKLLLRNCCENLFYTFESTELSDNLQEEIKNLKEIRKTSKKITHTIEEFNFPDIINNTIKSFGDFRRFPCLNSMLNTNQILFSNVGLVYEKALERKTVSSQISYKIPSTISYKFKNPLIIINPFASKLESWEFIKVEPKNQKK